MRAFLFYYGFPSLASKASYLNADLLDLLILAFFSRASKYHAYFFRKGDIRSSFSTCPTDFKSYRFNFFMPSDTDIFSMRRSIFSKPSYSGGSTRGGSMCKAVNASASTNKWISKTWMLTFCSTICGFLLITDDFLSKKNLDEVTS